MSPEVAHRVISGNAAFRSFGAKRTSRDDYAAKFMSGAFVEKGTNFFRLPQRPALAVEAPSIRVFWSRNNYFLEGDLTNPGPAKHSSGHLQTSAQPRASDRANFAPRARYGGTEPAEPDGHNHRTAAAGGERSRAASRPAGEARGTFGRAGSAQGDQSRDSRLNIPLGQPRWAQRHADQPLSRGATCGVAAA
ncbi:hypothetical protein V1278_000983 [Bradyrhizobium sp. AZCC 1577]